MSKKKQAEAAESEQKAAEQSAEAAAGQTETAEPAAEDWKAKFDELNDRYLRMAAEYDNFRKRSQREREQAYTDAVSRAVTALLPTYDNLERAIKAETADAEYKKGVEMTMTQLVKIFTELGVEIFGEPGETFDPNLHNAVMHTEQEDTPENTITQVFQKGFRLGEKIVRFAMVQVAN